MADPAPPPASGSPPRRPGVFAPKQATFRQRIAARLVWLAIRLVGATIRFQEHDASGYFGPGRQPPQLIFAFWHNRLALVVMIHRRSLARHWPGRRVAGLVSASRDGGFLARVMELFGALPVRGSTSKRGAQALLELTRAADQGADLAITPDGPRGPCYIVQEGVIAAAQITGLPIVPISYNLSWKWRLKSWDRFLVPLPFSRCDVRAGEPVHVPRDADEAARRAAREQLEAQLRALTQD
jgi:lysophospholipid acyltransferase (LPLAT)-like uncharacterized protein